MSHWEPGVGFLPLFRVGKKDGSLASDLLPRLALSLLSRTYAVTYFDDFLAFWTLGFVLLSWGGMDITFFFEDLEAETIHVCIAWALLKYLGFVLFFFLHLSTFDSSSIFSLSLFLACTSVFWGDG